MTSRRIATGTTIPSPACFGAFLTTWLDSIQNSNLNADFNTEGAVNSYDISAFLTCWLALIGPGCQESLRP